MNGLSAKVIGVLVRQPSPCVCYSLASFQRIPTKSYQTSRLEPPGQEFTWRPLSGPLGPFEAKGPFSPSAQNAGACAFFGHASGDWLLSGRPEAMSSLPCRLPQRGPFREADELLYHNQEPIIMTPLTPNHNTVLPAQA